MSRHSPLERRWLDEGFSVCPMSGRFMPGLATLFTRPDGKHLCFRVEVRAEHCNGNATAHGGFLATLADVWLAYNVLHLLPDTARIVTANLSVDYLAPALAGDCLESQIDRVRIGARLCHASGAILREGHPVVAMRGAFAVMEKKAGQLSG